MYTHHNRKIPIENLAYKKKYIVILFITQTDSFGGPRFKHRQTTTHDMHVISFIQVCMYR